MDPMVALLWAVIVWSIASASGVLVLHLGILAILERFMGDQ